ncbi:MAG: hypothetical protein PVF50_09000 [Gammaproteobacteria bacterium]|jgi:hypothetical protein
MNRYAILLVAAITGIAVIWLRGSGDTPQPRAQSVPADAAGQNSDIPDVLLADIEALTTLAQAYLPAGQFWQRDRHAEAERIERILSAEKQARAQLLDRFGPRAAQAPALWRVFRPLQERMPQLTSGQQILIHDLERQFAAARLRSEGQVPFSEHLERVRERLGAEIAREYALRSSPLAEELHRLGGEFSETSFRQAFVALSRLNETTDRASFVAARRQLRESLGNRPFARLWSLRDPRFERIEQAAKRFDLTAETILTAYALLLDNQDAMILTAATPDPTLRQNRLREQHETARRQLHELIGAPAADALLLASAGAPELPAD